jgi:hypothetical protein
MDLVCKLCSTPQIGQGVFARRNFKKGELVLSATGKILNYQTMYTIQIDWDCHLDVDAPAKYLNHSCNPNLGVKTGEKGFPQFYALRDIQKGEEVTFDYAMTEYMHYPRSDPSQEFDLTCLCNQTNCRGKLGYYSELSDELKEKYNGFISEYLVRESALTDSLVNAGYGAGNIG